MSMTVARLEHLEQPRRRLIVLGALGGYPAAVLVLVALKHTALNKWGILAVFGLLMVFTVAALTVAYGYARGRIDGRKALLDERDLEMREHAYAVAHRFLAAVLIGATAAVEVYLTNGNTLHLNANDTLPVMMWVVVYVPVLPSLMLAWSEPTQPVDD